MNKGYLGVAAAAAFLLLTLAVPGPSKSAGIHASMQDMVMDTAPNNVVDGSKNPEKISDKDAYQMFLIQDTQISSDTLAAVFTPLNLSSDEFVVVSGVVSDFGAEFQAENDAWAAIGIAGIPTKQQEHAHVKALKGITEEAMAKFELGLGVTRSRELTALLQFEKRHMAIAVEDNDENQN